MDPILRVAGAELPAYRMFTIAAALAGLGLTTVLAVRRGIRMRSALAVGAVAIAGGLVGGRLFAALTAVEPFWGDAGTAAALRFGDMAIFGGLAGALLAGIATTRLAGISATRFGDAAAPAIGIGIALLRVGCLLAGCCFGRETTLPWGITYPPGSFPHMHQIETSGSIAGVLERVGPVHPIPFYEMIAGVLLAALALVILRHRARAGTAFAVTAGGYAFLRLLIEPLRAPEPGGTPPWFDPVMFAAVAIAALVWLGWPLVVARRQMRQAAIA